MACRRVQPGRDPARRHCLARVSAQLLVLGALLFAPGLRAQTAPPPTPATPASASGPSLPASIPLKRDAPGDSAAAAGEGWWLAIAAVGIAMGFAVVAARRKARDGGAAASWWPQLRNPSPRDAIERLSSTRLSPRHSVHVVQWEGRRLLLGCSENAVALLAESKADAPASEGGR